jgi:hypothetical protein
MPQGQLLGDDAPDGVAKDVGSRDRKRFEQGGRVVGRGGHRERLLTHGRASHPAVVIGGEPVAVLQPVQLELPGLYGIGQPRDDQHLRALTATLHPEIDVPGPHLFTHGASPS